MINRYPISFDPDKVREALEKVLVDGKCPISGHRAWTVAPGYIQLRPVLGFSPILAPITSGRIRISGTSSETSSETIFSYAPPETGTVGGTAAFPVEESTYPVVMATCTGCGYIALFNAVVLGLVPSSEQNVPGWSTSPEWRGND